VSDRRATPQKVSTWKLIRSDYQAQYAYKQDGPLLRAALMLPRLVTNASMHAVILVRILARASRRTSWLWRRISVSAHGIEVAQGTRIGPGLQLPHPICIVFGPGVEIGSNVTIQHGVTLGGATERWWPGDPAGRVVVEDGVTFGPGSCAYGSVRIGQGAMIGANQIVTDDVPPGAVFTRGTARVKPAVTPESG
jgi:serine acetyltransferase